MLAADKHDEVREQALCPLGSTGSIPRISHGEQHQAASAGIRLHSPDMSQGRRSVPELVFCVVAGVGFEPT
jgi:hypothetical protein